jgi:hypothetical protein
VNDVNIEGVLVGAVEVYARCLASCIDNVVADGDRTVVSWFISITDVAEEVDSSGIDRIPWNNSLYSIPLDEDVAFVKGEDNATVIHSVEIVDAAVMDVVICDGCRKVGHANASLIIAVDVVVIYKNLAGSSRLIAGDVDAATSRGVPAAAMNIVENLVICDGDARV